MGTGVGEAMLIGAAVGGGTSAITGGDPLKGAIIGAAGGGFGSALGAAGTAFDPTALAGATELGSVAGTSSLNAAIDPSLASVNFGTMTPQAVGQGVSSGTIPIEAANQYGQSFSQAFEGIKPTNTPFSIRDFISKAPTPDITGSPEAQKQVAQATGKNIFGYMPGDKGFLSDTTLAAIGGGSALLGRKDSSGLPGEEDYVSSFDPSKFIRSTPTYAPGSVYVPEYKTYAAEGGIMQAYQAGGPVERMSMMNTAMNPQGGLYPQGMIDKTQYATPTQRPVSAEMVDAAPAYERSNPMLMAEGGQIPISLQGSVNLNPNNMASRAFSGAATSGPSMGNSTDMMLPQPALLPRFEGQRTGGPGMGPQGQISPGGPGGIGAAQLAVLPRTMAEGGIAGILEAAKSQGYTPMEYDQIYGRGNALQDMQAAMKRAKYASGGISSLGGYSDGGRMLKGPGDGMSDSIPGVIAGKQPARLADGEFVVPADVVSHLGNGSTDAGAKRLYSMMDKVRKARTGNKKQGKQINPNRFMPA